MILGVCQGITNLEHRAAKSGNANPVTMDDPSAIQMVDGSLMGSHLSRTLLGSTCNVFALLSGGRTAYLQHNDPFCGQRLCGKRAAEGAIDPKSILIKAVCLNDEWIAHARLIVRRQIKSAHHFVAVCSFPSNLLHSPEREPRKLGIQVEQKGLSLLPSIPEIQMRRSIEILFQNHFGVCDVSGSLVLRCFLPCPPLFLICEPDGCGFFGLLQN